MPTDESLGALGALSRSGHAQLTVIDDEDDFFTGFETQRAPDRSWDDDSTVFAETGTGFVGKNLWHDWHWYGS